MTLDFIYHNLNLDKNIYPNYSSKNIGFDGSGVNSKVDNFRIVGNKNKKFFFQKIIYKKNIEYKQEKYYKKIKIILLMNIVIVGFGTAGNITLIYLNQKN